MPDTPAIIHTHIERDRRMLWHPVLELRHRGHIIYAMSFVKGYIQPARAADVAAKQMIEVEKAGKRG